MYEFSSEEFKKYNNNNLFRRACDEAYSHGFSKEHMLSKLAIALLDEKEEDGKRRLEEIMMSTRTHFILNN